jgi:hypothetical protein
MFSSSLDRCAPRQSQFSPAPSSRCSPCHALSQCFDVFGFILLLIGAIKEPPKHPVTNNTDPANLDVHLFEENLVADPHNRMWTGEPVRLKRGDNRRGDVVSHSPVLEADLGPTSSKTTQLVIGGRNECISDGEGGCRRRVRGMRSSFPREEAENGESYYDACNHARFASSTAAAAVRCTVPGG